MDLRQLRGLEIARQKQAIRKTDGGWLVKSQSGSGFYRVDELFNCACPDCQKRGQTCKHQYAVRFYLKTEVQTPNGVIVKEKRITYAQNWRAYNHSQQTEKEHFLKLLKDLTAIEQEKNFGRPKANLGEIAFCCALKVYTQFSTRRANTDIKEAFEKGLISEPYHYNTVIKYFDNPELTPLLQELIAASAAPLKSVETDFAIDSSGFRTTKFNEYCNQKHGLGRQHSWLKAHIITGVKTNIITGVEITAENGADSPQLPVLVEKTAKNGFTIEEASADKAYASADNYNAVQQVGGTLFVPFKEGQTGNSRGSKYRLWRKMFHYFQMNQEEFYQKYHKRSNVETSFSMIKAKFNDMIKSRKPTAQTNELLCKILCHNLVVVIHEINELGIKAEFN